LEGDIQSGSFTKKMTLDTIVGLIAWLLVERSRGETKERSNVAGAKYNNSWTGVGRKKVCDTIRPSTHPWIRGNFRKHQIEHIEQTTAKLPNTCHEIW
jgi:hypothetical protein